MSETEKRRNIAFCFTEEKFKKLGWSEITLFNTKETLGSVYFFRVFPLELVDNSYKAKYGVDGIDVLVSKFTDQMVLCDIEEDKTGIRRRELDAFECFEKRNPEIMFVDSSEQQRLFTRRDLICERLQKSVSQTSTEPNKTRLFLSPKFTINETEGFNWPVICKPMCACGTEISHKMALCFTEKDVESFKSSFPDSVSRNGFIIQEFINHNGELYKAFCLGPDNVWFKRIRSFPSINMESTKSFCGGPLIFSSMKELYEKIDEWKTRYPKLFLESFDTEECSVDVINDIAKELIKSFDDTLMLGFDFIKEDDTGDIYVIDVNYFPSYKGCLTGPEIGKLLADITKKRTMIE